MLTAYRIPSGSMQPTLLAGDFIFSSRLSYGVPIPFSKNAYISRTPKRGDVVVFTYPSQPEVNFIKRVLGLPGDKIEIFQGRLKINGEALQYEKVQQPPPIANAELFEMHREYIGSNYWNLIFERQSKANNFGPLIVPEGEVFLLGDNRDASDDSRFWGTVPVERISGEVILVWLSLDWSQGGKLPRIRPERFLYSHLTKSTEQ